MKKLLVSISMICVCLLLANCRSITRTNSHSSTPRSEFALYEKYNELTLKISRAADQKLKKEIPDLHPSGSGGQIKGEQVVFRAFDIPRKIDEASGRELIVKITNAYLEAFNSSEEFRPFIREYPFTNRNFKISLFFGPPGTISPGKIHIISLMNGIIRYKADNPNDTFEHKGKIMYRLMTLHEETYENAVQESSGP